MEETICPSCKNGRDKSDKICPKCSKKNGMSFTYCLYTGIALSVILATIMNWIFPNDFSWWEKFCGLLFISVAGVKIATSR